MKPYQQDFLSACLKRDILKFGEFTLKSGRLSPYFFNMGRFEDGQGWAELGQAYAARIQDSGIAFDMAFGPAYKGIPLVTALAIALAEHHQRNIPFAFDRKEIKDHGEGGWLVGAPLKGRVLIVDDVISAGTAARESIERIHSTGAEVAGMLIGLDRQERGRSNFSAAQELSQEFGFQVIAIAGLAEVIELLDRDGQSAMVKKMQIYKDRYGVDP